MNRLLIRRKALLLYVVLCLALVATACKDKNLRDLLVASDKVAETVTIIQKAVVDGETATILNRNQARAIMELTIRISKANNSADVIARDLAKLDEPSRAQLLTILTPIIREVDAGVNDPAILGIQNVQTRDAIRGSLVVVQTTLNSINLILSAKK